MMLLHLRFFRANATDALLLLGRMNQAQIARVHYAFDPPIEIVHDESPSSILPAGKYTYSDEIAVLDRVLISI